jgi:hypothetical protein
VAKHSLEDGGGGSAEHGEEEAEGKGVEEDGACENLFADPEKVLLGGGFEEVGEEVQPEKEREGVTIGVGVACGLEKLVVIAQTQVRGI